MSNEHTQSRKLRDKLLQTPGIFFWKINDSFAGGVVDAFIEGPTRDMWLEAKHIKALPKRPSTIIDLCNEKYYLSMLQQAWLHRRAQKRQDAAVLLTTEEGCILFLHGAWQIPLTTEALRAKLVPFNTIVTQIKQFIGA